MRTAGSVVQRIVDSNVNHRVDARLMQRVEGRGKASGARGARRLLIPDGDSVSAGELGNESIYTRNKQSF